MEQESNEDFIYSLKDILRYAVDMIKNGLKSDLEEESKLPKELQDAINRVDKKEATVRIEGIETKVVGRKPSFNKKITASKEKSSLRVERINVRKDSAIGEKAHEKEMMDENIDMEIVD